MNGLRTKYLNFKAIGGSKYSPEKYREYKKSKKIMFSMIKAEYLNSGKKEKSVEDIINALSEEEKDPIKFWGSEKTAERNHYVYITDKEGRLFEELCNWYERRIGYDKSGKT